MPVETGWIQTFRGERFYPMAPRADQIYIEDIAHALSNLCRYNGHCQEYYSVAQHSVLVSQIVPREHALWGLLHDAAEAYLVDLPRPVKWWLREQGITVFDEIESKLMAAICERFGLSREEPACIKEADILLLTTESRDLRSPLAQGWHYCEQNGYKALPQKISPMSPRMACSFFATRLLELCPATGGVRHES